MDNASRIAFRLKDLLTVICDKSTLIRIFYNDCEINYDEADIYKDYYISNIALGEENGSAAIIVSVSNSIEYIYIPAVE